MKFIVFSYNKKREINVEEVEHIRHDKAKNIFSDDYMRYNKIKPTESYILFYMKSGDIIEFDSDYRIIVK